MKRAGIFLGMALVTALTASSAPVWASRGEDPAATYVWRGLHLDESRHFFGKETVKEILDRMSRTKLNTFHWHLVDDHGWRLQIDRYPNLTKRGAVRRLVKDYAPQPSWRDLSDHGEYGPYFYTKDDVREIVAYAHARGIRVVPEIEIPGHSLAACASYPELSCFPENPKGEDTFLHPSWRTQAVGKRVMCLSKPFTYEFLENVLDEVCELFPDEFIHLGGDEVPIWNWKACTNCQAKIAREGLGDEHGLKHQAMRHFCEYVIKKGKRPVCWEEIVAAGAPTQTVAMVWHEPEGAVKIAEMGYDVIMTPYGTCYLDDPAGELSIDRIRAFDPRAALPSHLRHKVIGAQTCSWTELICTSRELLMQMWPRAGALFSGGFVRTGFRLSTLFGDGAVVQRRKTVPVWGYGAEPGLRMEATLGKAHGFATANRDGDFLFRLPPQEAGGPYELKVRDEKGRELVSRDVYVGEVWICSGQSNMEFKMPGAKPGFGERDFPLVRMFNVGYATGETPMREPQGSWIPGKVGFADAFSAVGGFFARRLQQELGVAVGMLNASVGGTRIEAWMSRRALGACAAGREVLAEAESSFHDPIYWDDSCEYQSDVWPLDEGPGDKVAWAKPSAEDAGWIKAQVPGYFSEQYKSNFNGAVWYRRTVEIPSAWAGHRLALEIPCADKMDIAYFDGVEIGRTGSRYTTWYHDKPRRYEVPASLVKAGAATLAIRVWSQAYAGGIGGEPAKLRLVLADDVGDPLVVGGEWLTRIERNVGVTPNGKLPFVPSTDRSPGSLYQSMVAPLVPYAVAGAIWYQGESNASRRGKSDRYGDLLAEMVRDWRGAFDCGDFAFCATELAGFESPKPFNPLSPWSEIGAECLRASREVPNCGVVSARDLFIPDNPSDIHPTDKQAIGNRFAQWALATQYGRTDLVACGPRFLSAAAKGDAVVCRFTETGSGLMVKGRADGAVAGFWLKGSDGVFRAAAARIEGETVVVSAPGVTRPTELRYAWKQNAAEANLYNREGLPATAFSWSAGR